MRSSFLHAAIGVSLFIVFVSVAYSEGSPTASLDRALLRPLTEAGVALDDVDALIGLLETNREGFAPHAAYALSRLPKSERIIEALRKATKSEDEGLMIYAMRALVAHGDRSWVPEAEQRLYSLRRPALPPQLAGLLAQAGAYKGWPVIVRALLDEHPEGDGSAIDALMQVRHFVGMADAEGKPVDLAAELRRIAEQAPAAHREEIAKTYYQLKSKRARPAPAEQPQPK